MEALQRRLSPGQFIVLMRAFNACRAARAGAGTGSGPGTGGGAPHLGLASGEQELFTPEVQSEMLTLMGLAEQPALRVDRRPPAA